MPGCFFMAEPNDVQWFPSLEKMAGHAEVFDLAVLEFFDDKGQRFLASADGFRVRLAPSGNNEASRLEQLLRRYFDVLPVKHASYSERARQCQSLSELVELRQELG